MRPAGARHGAQPRFPPLPYSPQVHCALERCIQRGMSKWEAVQLLARWGVAPKFSLLGEPAAPARPPRRPPYPRRNRALSAASHA